MFIRVWKAERLICRNFCQVKVFNKELENHIVNCFWWRLGNWAEASLSDLGSNAVTSLKPCRLYFCAFQIYYGDKVVSVKIRRLLFSEYTWAALSKVAKITTEQPLASFSAKHSNKYCCLCTTLSKKVVQSRKKAGQKQEKAEEVGREHVLRCRELATDNTKSIKCVSTERCGDSIELICQ